MASAMAAGYGEMLREEEDDEQGLVAAAAGGPQETQPMSGDSPFGGGDPITDNLDTSPINSGESTGMASSPGGGIDLDAVVPPYNPPSSDPNNLPFGTASNNTTVNAPIVDPMYYQDEFIDSSIKEGINERSYVDNTAAQAQAAGVGAADPMQAAQIGTVAGPTAAQINPQDLMARQAQKSQLQILGDIAGGQMSPVIQQQRDRATQEALAMMATQRGVPAAAAMRTGMQGMSEANRQATEAAAQQQLQATQALGDAAGQMRGQEIDIAGQQANLQQEAGLTGYQGALQTSQQQAELEQTARMTNQELAQGRNDLLAQFQQQTNLSNAEMQNEMIMATDQVNAQLEQQRDSMIASLTGMGVDRDVALLQVNAEMARLEQELLYKYWAGKLGAGTQILGNIIEGTDTTAEDIFENVVEEGSVLNLVGGYQTPEGYEVGGMQVTGPLGYQGGLSDPTEPVGPDDSGWTLPENQPGASYSGSSTSGGTGSGAGGNWYKDPVTGQWVRSGIEAKENVAPIGTKDEFYRTRSSDRFGQMETPGNELALRTSITDPMAMQTRQEPDPVLGQIRRGLKRDAANRNMAQEMEDIRATNQMLERKANEDKNLAKGFKEGADFVGDALEIANLTEAGERALSGDEASQRSLLSTGVQKGVSEAIDYTAETMDDISTAVSGTAESGYSAAAATAAPFIGGALKFIGSTIQGQEMAPAAIGATGAGLGAAAGKAGGGALGGAIGSLFPGAGTAIGAAIGSAVGGAAGGAGGYMATQPLRGLASSPESMKERKSRFSRAMSPESGVVDMGSFVGAPSAPGFVRSGLETKRYIEDLAPISSDMRYGEISDENAKMGIGKSEDELSDFLRELNPVKYDYKPEYGGEKNQYGIIAQDAQKTPVGDSFVKKNNDGTHMIDTGKATMVNMAALANQQKILDQQGDLIARLLGEY